MVVLRSTCPDVVMLTPLLPLTTLTRLLTLVMNTRTLLTLSATNTLTPESWTRVLSPGPPQHSDSTPEHSRWCPESDIAAWSPASSA